MKDFNKVPCFHSDPDSKKRHRKVISALRASNSWEIFFFSIFDFSTIYKTIISKPHLTNTLKQRWCYFIFMLQIIKMINNILVVICV